MGQWKALPELRNAYGASQTRTSRASCGGKGFPNSHCHPCQSHLRKSMLVSIGSVDYASDWMRSQIRSVFLAPSCQRPKRRLENTAASALTVDRSTGAHLFHNQSAAAREFGPAASIAESIGIDGLEESCLRRFPRLLVEPC